MKDTSTPVCIGLLPFYIALYDASTPELRPRLEAFYETIACSLETRGIRVLRSPFCRLEDEFTAAIQRFETGGAAAIVTLHLAYSPSLESADALAATALPIIVLDTTDTYRFCEQEDILYCHGIHGVMDMCNLLHKNGKSFSIAAGHWEKSDLLDRTAALIREAAKQSQPAGSARLSHHQSYCDNARRI